MSQVLIACILVAAFLTTLFAGLGWTYVVIYLPCMVLLNHVQEVNVIPHVPMSAQFAPLYGILLALPFRGGGESVRLRLCSVDIVMLLLLISGTITAWTSEWYETAFMTFRNDLLMWYAPYFLSRIVFQKLQMRAAALNVLIVLIAIMSVSALIEFRFAPYWYLHELANFGVGAKVPVMAYHRYGMNRVSGPVAHPIYFGNMCLTLLGLVTVLAKTSGRKLSDIWVVLALFGAAGCVVTSISFTPYVGVMAAAGFVVLMTIIKPLRLFILPITLCVFVGLFAFSYHLAHTPQAEHTEGESDLAGSMRTRQLIVTQSWKRAAEAGPIGFGKNFNQNNGDEADEFDLSSVDNTYFMLAMTRGWVYVTLWVSIGVLLSMRMTFAFVKASRSPATQASQAFPLLVGISTVLAVMISMYTVWAGALYVVIWMILVGLCNTLIDLILYGPAPVRLAGPTGMGAPVTVRTVTRPTAGLLNAPALHGSRFPV